MMTVFLKKNLVLVLLSLSLGLGLSACKEEKPAAPSAVPQVSSEKALPSTVPSSEATKTATPTPVRSEVRGYSAEQFKEDLDKIEKTQTKIDQDREALLDRCVGVSESSVVQSCKDDRKKISDRVTALYAEKQAVVDRVKAMRQESLARRKKALELLGHLEGMNKEKAEKKDAVDSAEKVVPKK